MAQMTNVQGIKIRDQIEALFGRVDAEEFSTALPLSKSADSTRKFKWAKDVCTYLERKYSSEQIVALRMACSCHTDNKEKGNTKLIYNESGNLDEFCERYNNEYAAQYSVWHDRDTLFFSYPTCYCNCVNRVSETISPTWCLCTLGYVKDLFDYVSERDTKVELIESVKLGDNRCVIKITFS